MMQEFDPRRPAFRIAPRMMAGLACCFALALGWRLTAAEAHLPGAGLLALDAARVASLQTQAFAEAETMPGLLAPQSIDVEVDNNESIEAAVRRIGVSAEEATQVADLLGQSIDAVHVRAGTMFKAAIAAPRDPRGSVRLLGLSMRTGPASVITVSRSFDGALRMRSMDEKIFDETTVAMGGVEDSFYESAAEQGSTSILTRQAEKLFSQKVDFSRDICAGDNFKLVFTRKVTESGRTVESGDLLYAEVSACRRGSQAMRFYRYEPAGGGEVQFYDEAGKNVRGFLLATPLAVARVTSNFGMRRHPVLGYNKIHQGIDFAGSTGTPIYAAGDGVISEAGRKGGYGNWISIRHDGIWSTGYAHMSRFAAGMRRGARVKQGQLIGYVGATGRVTGPHLHYEVMRNGVKISPKNAKVPSGSALGGAELQAFLKQKGVIDATLQQAQQSGQTHIRNAVQVADATPVRQAPVQNPLELRTTRPAAVARR